MTLKSLKKLRYLMDSYWDSDSSDPFEYAESLADEIQAEVDRDYVPRSKALYDSLVPLYVSDWCMEHNKDLCDYIEHFYLPRPLFEDGRPMQFLDEVSDGTMQYAVTSITLFADGSFDLYYDCGFEGDFPPGQRLKRPEPPDTQERIDTDAMLSPEQYCKKYDLPPQAHDMYALDREKSKHLLERQRKLLGGDAS